MRGGARGVPQGVRQGLADDPVDRLGRRTREVGGEYGIDGPSQPAESGDEFLDARGHRTWIRTLDVPQQANKALQRRHGLGAGALGERQRLGRQLGPAAAESARGVGGDDDGRQVMGAHVVQFAGQPPPFGVARPPPGLLRAGQPAGRERPSLEPLSSGLTESRADDVQERAEHPLRGERGPDPDVDERQEPLDTHGRGERAYGHGHGAADGDRIQRDRRTHAEVAVVPPHLAQQESTQGPGQGLHRRLPSSAQRSSLGDHRAQDRDKGSRPGHFRAGQVGSRPQPGDLSGREQRGEQPVA